MLKNVKKSLVLFSVLWNSIALAKTIDMDITSPIQRIEVNGAMDIELTANVTRNHIQVIYDDKNGQVVVDDKNGLLTIRSEGVFNSKPSAKINLIDAPLYYATSGIVQSILHFESENDVNIDIDGVSKAKIKGRSANIFFKLSGTSSLDLIEYTANSFKGYLSGISSLYINKDSPLIVEKQGISKIIYP